MTLLNKRNKIVVKDFEIGEQFTVNGLTYVVTRVEPDFIECRLNRVTKKFAKVLYCGVYAAMSFGKPLFLSSKIERAKEEEYKPRKYTKRASNVKSRD